MIAESVSTGSQAWTIGLTAGGFGLLTIIVNSIISSKKEKRDYARQDQVANRLETKQNEVADRLERRTDQTTAELRKVKESNDEIHGFLNSDKTQELKDKRIDLQVTLALIQERLDDKKKAGELPTKETLAAWDSLTKRITNLDESILERERQQEANAQAKTEATE